ncbi:hypothetical protein [Acinetobacter indicus]|uniref:hypothetical protein n=1 Tax=Acinetobacter indicus TaxID=756892 RepID=UPI003B012268
MSFGQNNLQKGSYDVSFGQNNLQKGSYDVSQNRKTGLKVAIMCAANSILIVHSP